MVKFILSEFYFKLKKYKLMGSTKWFYNRCPTVVYNSYQRSGIWNLFKECRGRKYYELQKGKRRRIKTSSRLSEKLGYMAWLSEVWLGLQEGGRHPGEMIFPYMGWFSYATTWTENHILKHKWHEVTQKPNVAHRWKIFGAHTYFKMGKIYLKYGFRTSLKN